VRSGITVAPLIAASISAALAQVSLRDDLRFAAHSGNLSGVVVRMALDGLADDRCHVLGHNPVATKREPLPGQTRAGQRLIWKKSSKRPTKGVQGIARKVPLGPSAAVSRHDHSGGEPRRDREQPSRPRPRRGARSAGRHRSPDEPPLSASAARCFGFRPRTKPAEDPPTTAR